MRVGRAFSEVLDPCAALFGDVCLDLTLEEAWHPSCLGTAVTSQASRMPRLLRISRELRFKVQLRNQANLHLYAARPEDQLVQHSM